MRVPASFRHSQVRPLRCRIGQLVIHRRSWFSLPWQDAALTILFLLREWLNLSLYNTLQWRHNERDGVSNHRRIDCLPDCLFRWRSKIPSKLSVTSLCKGNSPVTGEFPAQRASNAEKVSIWWRYHAEIGNVFSCFLEIHSARHRFAAQMASNTENVFIWWRHHGKHLAFSTDGMGAYWIGFRTLGIPNVLSGYRWTSGDGTVPFENYQGGEPNNVVNKWPEEYCTERRGTNWNNLNCKNKMTFVCEVPKCRKKCCVWIIWHK